MHAKYVTLPACLPVWLMMCVSLPALPPPSPRRANKFKVTNGEFLRFVKAGGYSSPKYWSTEGWGWKTFRNVKWPTFWMPDGPQGLHR